MITHYRTNGQSSLIDSTSITSPVLVFTSTTTGRPVGDGGASAQRNAITTIALCNTGAADLEDETVNSVVTNIYIVRQGQTYQPGDLIVSNLIIPAGETVFFSEERLVLDPGDQLWIGTSSSDLIAVTVSSLPV
jgi:hypothetical protein